MHPALVAEDGSKMLELDQHQRDQREECYMQEEEEVAHARTLEGAGQKQQTVEH